MKERVLFPDAIDYVRSINNNVVNNALGGRSSYMLIPPLYQRAYILNRRTGAVQITEGFVAPDETTTTSREAEVRILTSDQ